MQRRMPRTLADIALIANVPVEMVSKVLFGHPDVADDVRQRVQRALASITSVNMAVKPEQAADAMIGVVVPGALVDDYTGQIVQGIAEAAKSRNMEIILNMQPPDQPRASLENAGDGGIIVIPHQYEHLIQLFRQRSHPFVLIDYKSDQDVSDEATVVVRHEQGIRMVMEHLFNLGHRRIGFITGILDMASAQERYEGYWYALDEAGIEYDSAIVKEGDFSHSMGYQRAMELLQMENRPTAIVASNDLSAFGVIQAADELGLSVGRDVSLTGFDDLPMAATVSPALTTVRQPMQEMGHGAVALLTKLMAREPIASRHIEFDTSLIVRDSTGRAPRQ